jgi:serine/threonine protein kinase
MLTPESWKKINELFHRAMDTAPEERSGFLDRETNGQPELRRELESLLLSSEQEDDFLEEPIIPRVAEAIAKKQSESRELHDGDKHGDFLILRTLGKGSFATVYLAHQLSLNRKVALKVSANQGEEARNMAHLEHDNIVKVFSETIDAANNMRCICMQYVPGPSLETILREVGRRPPGCVTGATLLEIIDGIETSESAFNPAALKDRELLAQLDAVDAAIWMGLRLADALAYAHERGVLHLDVKPGNVLVSPYGRAMLTDFNVSVDRTTLAKGTPMMVGGTVNYMSPEHATLFETRDMGAALARIDHRADIYSLGIVIREMIVKLSGFPRVFESLPELEQIVDKCLSPTPGGRYASAQELTRALEGCLELRDIVNRLPPAGPITRFTLGFPVAAMIVFSVAPQILGSVVNISYNSMRIVSEFTPEQRSLFHTLCIIYNLVIYPVCVAIFYRQLVPIIRVLKEPLSKRCMNEETIRDLRKRVLNLPLWMVVVTTLGWVPGSLFFPLTIHLIRGPLQPAIFGHFFISFTLSWLIALAYSFLYIQFIAVRAIYPQLCMGNAGIRRNARQELCVLAPAMRLIHFTAGFVPLIGAALVVYVGPEKLDASHYNTYRLLVSILIASGMIGLLFAIRATNLLAQTLYAITGSDKASSGE